MSNDEKSKGIEETLVEATKGLAIEVYRDAAKPAVAEVGKTLGNIVELALAIPNGIFSNAKAAFDRLAAALRRKLAGVPQDRLQLPPATLAAGAAFQYALLGDGDEVAELREMFENLLMTSMDKETTSLAHPAFVSMVSQMSPDEAWMLKSITTTLRIPIVEVRQQKPDSHLHRIVGLVCNLGYDLGIGQTRQVTGLSNLERLGIITINWNSFINDETGEIYRPLLERMQREFASFSPIDHKGIVEFTPMGGQLWRVCVRPRQ